MKVLLVYPPYTHSNAFDSRAPSLSLFYLAAELMRRGHSVRIYDASLGPVVKTKNVYRYGRSEEEMVAFLRQEAFDMVGITCSFTARWRFVSQLAGWVKHIYPRVPVVVGGLFPTSEWEYCLRRCPDIDVILLGEGELSFGELVDRLADGQSWAEACALIDGIAWRAGENLNRNPKEKYIENLDKLEFPAWQLVDLNDYFKVQRRIFELAVPCLPILSSRSCPNRCSFCNMYITHGRRWRMRSAANVLSEIEYLIQRFGVRRFYFIDDNFSIDLARAKAICRGLLDRQLRIQYNFHNGLSIKSLDRELVGLMKASGCTSVCLAIESGSERIRNGVYRKNLKTEKIVEVFAWFREAGIPTIGYFMVGAPGETRADFEMSKRLMAELPMTLATVGIYTPYPQTELYDECKEKGWLIETEAADDNRVELFTSFLRTPDFTPEVVAGWQRELYLSFIRHHWLTLGREMFRRGGVVNKDMIGKFWGMLLSRFGGVGRNKG